MRFKSLAPGISAIILVCAIAAASFLAGGCGGQSADTGATDTAATGTSAALSSKDLYRQAVANAVTQKPQDISGTFAIDTSDIKLNADFEGAPNGDNVSLDANAQVSSDMQGVPMTMSMELIAIKNPNQDDGYMKVKSVTSSNPAYKQRIEAYFAPAVNQWAKMKQVDKPDEPSTFDKDGPLASLDMLSVFDPLVSIPADDQQKYLSILDKDNLFQVADGVETAQFEGQTARKIRVTITKQAFVQVDNDAGASLSPAAHYKKSDPKYADEAFGKSNTFSADVYLDQNSAKIIGVDLVINLDPPINESTFNTKMSQINASLIVKSGPQKPIKAPDKFITEQQLDALMKHTQPT